MGWLGKLFGTDEAVKGVLNTGKELLDESFYTAQEKAEGSNQAAQEVRSMIIDWLKNTQGQNLSRRVIALSTTATWLLMFITATVMSVVAVWTGDDISTRLNTSTELLDARLEVLTGAVLLILGFYFAAPKISEIAGAVLTKFSK